MPMVSQLSNSNQLQGLEQKRVDAIREESSELIPENVPVLDSAVGFSESPLTALTKQLRRHS